MSMNHFLVMYIIQIFANPICLWVCGWLLKHTVKNFPNKLIPVVLITLSVVMSITIPNNPAANALQLETHIIPHGLLEDSAFGLIIAFFSIGVHAVTKDIISSIKMKRWSKQYTEAAGKNITISMTESGTDRSGKEE